MKFPIDLTIYKPLKFNTSQDEKKGRLQVRIVMIAAAIVALAANSASADKRLTIGMEIVQNARQQCEDFENGQFHSADLLPYSFIKTNNHLISCNIIFLDIYSNIFYTRLPHIYHSKWRPYERLQNDL